MPADTQRPLRLDLPRVLLFGTGLWLLALVVTLLVPALHSDERDGWPMICAAGVVLGLLGYGLARARGGSRRAGGR